MFKHKINTKSGITLIALVVTIIVLLLLAGISVQMLTGNNGILVRAGEAKITTNNAQTIEKMQLAYLSALSEGKDNLTEQIFKEELIKEFGKDKVNDDTIYTSSDAKTWTVTIDSVSVDFIAGKDATPSPIVEDKNGIKIDSSDNTKPYLPMEDMEILSNDLSSGVVVKDRLNNEWVWIEVPKSLYSDENNNTENELEDMKPLSKEDTDKIEFCLKKYSAVYKHSQCLNWSDIWYAKDESTLITENNEELTDTQKQLNNGCGLTYLEYKSLKENMLKSIYKNGGFWIGRYEAGISSNRTSRSAITTQVPKIQPDLYPFTYVYCSDAQKLSTNLGAALELGESYNCSLMYGIQWDLVLKYIESKGGATSNQLITDCSEIGNFRTSTFTLKRGKYATYSKSKLNTTWNKFSVNTTGFVENREKKSQTSKSNGVLITTGATEYSKLQNIYDIAGNVTEYTLECTLVTENPCSRRGGEFGTIIVMVQTGYRSANDITSGGCSSGFRPSIY